MTLYQFKALDEMEQIEAVWNKGIKLGERKEEEELYEMYQIDDFYIELRGHIDSIGYNNIKTFRNPDLLTPYLEQIDIANIVELSCINTAIPIIEDKPTKKLLFKILIYIILIFFLGIVIGRAIALLS